MTSHIQEEGVCSFVSKAKGNVVMTWEEQGQKIDLHKVSEEEHFLLPSLVDLIFML